MTLIDGVRRNTVWINEMRQCFIKPQRHYILALLALVVSGLWGLAPTESTSFAQTADSAWTPPMRLFETDGALHEPAIVVDRTGLAHIFWTVEEASDGRPTGQTTVYYAQCCENGKARLTDILAVPSLSSPRAVIDNTGEIHLIISNRSQLYYTHAPLTQALSAPSWAPLTLIDEAATHADIALDAKGRLHIAYARFGVGGPYYRTSNDAGRTWSPPINVAPTTGPDAMAEYVRIVVTDAGALHVVWTEFKLPVAWPPVGVFYARSDDGGQSWSKPLMMAGEGYDQINILAADQNTLHLAWNASASGRGRFHQLSSDGGRTWSGATEMYPAAGTTGPPSLAADAAGVVHFLSSEGNVQGPVASMWTRQGWTRPTAIADPGAPLSNYVEEAVMAIGQGNRLHVIYWNDRKNLWYQTRTTEAPLVTQPAYPRPTPAPSATATDAPTPVVTVAPRRTGDASSSVREGALALAEQGTGRNEALLAGILPVVVLLMGVLAVHHVRSWRK